MTTTDTRDAQSTAGAVPAPQAPHPFAMLSNLPSPAYVDPAPDAAASIVPGKTYVAAVGPRGPGDASQILREQDAYRRGYEAAKALLGGPSSGANPGAVEALIQNALDAAANAEQARLQPTARHDYTPNREAAERARNDAHDKVLDAVRASIAAKGRAPDNEPSGAVDRLRDALDIFDRVKAATEAEKIAVGSDHWNGLEKAARAVVAEGRARAVGRGEA